MHNLFNHILKYLRNLLLFSLISLFSLNAFAEQSVEDIIKGRQQIFDKNYTMAKRVQSLSEQGKFDEAINLMIRMSEGYKKVVDMFPENTREGFGTEALPTIWEDKENFNQLMVKASDDLIKLTSLIKETDNIEATLGQFMWGNCAAWKAVENALPILRDDTEISFIFFEEGEDPDSFVSKKGKDAFKKITNESISLSEYFFDKVKAYNLERLEGRSQAIAFAKPLIDSINNEVIRSVYLNELSKICDVTLAQLPKTGKNQYKLQANQPKDTPAQPDIRLRSMTNIFSALINYPDLAQPEYFQPLVENEKFSFLFEILNLYQSSPSIKPSRVIEGITSEKIRDLFSQATVNELKISKEDAKKLVFDCVAVLAKNQKDREEILKQQYNSRSISAEGRRELQKIILTKDDLSTDDQKWLQKLSAKNN